MELLIAEKPSVAKNIATALGATVRKDGYYEGNGYLVTYAFGHLYQAYDVKDYNPEIDKWKIEDYPFIPSKFKYKPINDEGVKKQIEIIRKLIERSELVICATDSDREGALIWTCIKEELNIRKPTKTLWVTSHTPEDIKKGMNSLREDMLDLQAAGSCRQKIDWLLGISFTVLFTLKSGGGKTLNIGRTILGTLKLIYDREVEIQTFKSKNFYVLHSEFNLNKDKYIGTYILDDNSKFKSKDELVSIEKVIKNKSGTIIKKESKESSKDSPKLFSLTDLQAYIANEYDNFTADKVLKVTQSLYEKKVVTYPRTASKYLDETLTQDAEKALNAVINYQGMNIKNKESIQFHTEKSVFDSTKVDSHPAIIPTYILPENLTKDEEIVYTEIAKRFIAKFMPKAKYESLEVLTKVEGHEFITKGNRLVSEGWISLYNSKKSNDEILAIDLKENDTVKVKECQIEDGKTKPKKYYTESTLLSAMETCGRIVEDEEEILKGFTIGTPATRGETIKKLLNIEYIVKKGKTIKLSALGAKVVQNFPIKNFLRVDFTGKIEKTLKEIEQGEYDPEVFMKKMIEYIVKKAEELKCSDIPIIAGEKNIIGKCPACGKNVVENKKTYACEGTKDKKCDFAIWKDDKIFKMYGKRMTERVAKELVNKQYISLKGLKSPKKEGVKFDADFKLVKKENGYWGYEMSFNNKKRKKVKRKK